MSFIANYGIKKDAALVILVIITEENRDLLTLTFTLCADLI